jgi:hypothetical protein
LPGIDHGNIVVGIGLASAGKADVGECHVDPGAVRRYPPLNPSEYATLAYARLPKSLAPAIWIEGVEHARLLRDDESPVTLRETDQDG